MNRFGNKRRKVGNAPPKLKDGAQRRVVVAPRQMRGKNARARAIQDAFVQKYGDRVVNTVPIHVRSVGRVAAGTRADGDGEPPAGEDAPAGRELLKIRGCLISSKPVERWGYDSRRGEFMFMEILPAVEGKLNLDRAKKGIPILKNHDQWDLHSRIGVWKNPTFVGKDASESGFDEVWFDGFISIDDDTRIICGRIEDGSMLDLSVGYWVPDYDTAGQEDGEDDIPVLVARDAEVLEGSLVTVPADLNSSAEVRIIGGTNMAGRRTQKGDTARRQTSRTPTGRGGNQSQRGANDRAPENSAADDEDGGEDGDDDSDEDEDLDAGDDELDPNDDADEGDEDEDDAAADEAQRSTATRAQTRRNKSIDTLCRSITNSPAAAAKLARQFHNTSATDAEIIAKHAENLAARSASRQDSGRSGAMGGSPQGRGNAPEIVNALDRLPNGSRSRIQGRAALIRGAVSVARGQAPTGDSAQFAGMTADHMFGNLFRAYGVRYKPGVNPMDQLNQVRAVAPVLFEEAKALIGDVFTNLILAPTDAVPAFIGEGWTRRLGSSTFLRQGGWMGSTYEPLVKHIPGGEIPLRRRKSFVAWFQLDTHVGRYAIERRDFEDSALAYLADLSVAAATAARRAHNGALIDAMRINPELLDGIPFHHVRRGNVAENMDLTVSNVIKAQQALAGQDLTIAAPILLYSADLYEKALRVSTPLTVTDPEKLNPLGGKIRPFQVPGMPAGSWEVLVEAGTRPAYIDLYKTDRPNHVTTLHDTAQFDGFEMKVTDDKGAAVCDPRGSFRAYVGEAPEELDSFDGADTFEVDYGFED